MKIEEILAMCDHTLLSPTATEQEILALCDEGIKYGTASVCIPPCYVKTAKEYVGSRLAICTVIGFPTGYSAKEIKVMETERAVSDGADEIDMVINLGMLKMKKYDRVLEEIKAVRQACDGKILKVIIETCLLTEEEKIKMCDIVSNSGADYIKTSTGFSSAGATKEDVLLMKNNCQKYLKIKAAGGISTLEDAEEFTLLGASRLGTSKIVKIAVSKDAKAKGEVAL